MDQALHQGETPTAPAGRGSKRALDPIDQQLTALDAETSVSVQLHPVSSLELVALDISSLQGGPDEQRAQELHLREGSLRIAGPDSLLAVTRRGSPSVSTRRSARAARVRSASRRRLSAQAA